MGYVECKCVSGGHPYKQDLLMGGGNTGLLSSPCRTETELCIKWGGFREIKKIRKLLMRVCARQFQRVIAPSFGGVSRPQIRGVSDRTEKCVAPRLERSKTVLTGHRGTHCSSCQNFQAVSLAHM